MSEIVSEKRAINVDKMKDEMIYVITPWRQKNTQHIERVETMKSGKGGIAQYIDSIEIGTS